MFIFRTLEDTDEEVQLFVKVVKRLPKLFECRGSANI